MGTSECRMTSTKSTVPFKCGSGQLTSASNTKYTLSKLGRRSAANYGYKPGRRQCVGLLTLASELERSRSTCRSETRRLLLSTAVAHLAETSASKSLCCNHRCALGCVARLRRPSHLLVGTYSSDALALDLVIKIMFVSRGKTG